MKVTLFVLVAALIAGVGGYVIGSVITPASTADVVALIWGMVVGFASIISYSFTEGL